MTPELEEQCRRMRQGGQTWKAIARSIGVSPDTVQRALDPEWAAKRRAQVNAARARRRLPTTASKPAVRAETRRDAERLWQEVPDDTRSMTAVLMGDPLPGRSALDQIEARR